MDCHHLSPLLAGTVATCAPEAVPRRASVAVACRTTPNSHANVPCNTHGMDVWKCDSGGRASVTLARPLCDAGMGLRIDNSMCTSLANRYEQAAAQGNADGLFNLACMLRQGQGIPAGTLPTK